MGSSPASLAGRWQGTQWLHVHMKVPVPDQTLWTLPERSCKLTMQGSSASQSAAWWGGGAGHGSVCPGPCCMDPAQMPQAEGGTGGSAAGACILHTASEWAAWPVCIAGSVPCCGCGTGWQPWVSLGMRGGPHRGGCCRAQRCLPACGSPAEHPPGNRARSAGSNSLQRPAQHFLIKPQTDKAVSSWLHRRHWASLCSCMSDR